MTPACSRFVILSLALLAVAGCGRGKAGGARASGPGPASGYGRSTAGPIPESELPELGRIAEFTLRSQDGQPFESSSLRGQAWVVSFIFTHCPSICPLMVREMNRMAKDWRKQPQIQFLSISVDPERDTPEVLREYAERNELLLRNWTLLTGDKEEIRHLCLESFKLALGESMDERGDITHSFRFVLIDQEGRIRGYYDSQDPAKREELDRALQGLVQRLELPPDEHQG